MNDLDINMPIACPTIIGNRTSRALTLHVIVLFANICGSRGRYGRRPYERNYLKRHSKTIIFNSFIMIIVFTVHHSSVFINYNHGEDFDADCVNKIINAVFYKNPTCRSNFFLCSKKKTLTELLLLNCYICI